ncbi:hypothetical protein WICPIJ_002696 [Wickerhamomyces pijperi]|uniref:Uncharacterized protein n=1 Tax=Wickerhamomyces pijperi TaxID=599730 RepID=A0A9P8QBC3_WICPI|nr:hypothetical protein WICPIJ_002696 [Wickerhamomyces pijperi]
MTKEHLAITKEREKGYRAHPLNEYCDLQKALYPILPQFTAQSAQLCNKWYQMTPNPPERQKDMHEDPISYDCESRAVTVRTFGHRSNILATLKRY